MIAKLKQPMDANIRLIKSTKELVNAKKHPYKEAIGILIYLMISSRPDIAFSVCKLSQFMDTYDETHWTAVKHVLRYLKGTNDYGITYYRNGVNKLEGFCAGDQESRKSTLGFIFMMNGGAIS